MPPEFIQRQIITKAFDIYSLGIIFIELVTGTRVGFRDTNFLEISSAVIVEQAHEEWMQRLQKTVHVTSVEGYFQQVKKCLKIGLQCVERDRHRRPTITNIVDTLNETEINCGLLVVHPQELQFLPFRTNKKAMISCTLELNNRGDDRVAFMLVANRPKMYLTKKPLCGIVPPRCAYSLTLTMMPNKIMELSSKKKIMGPPSSSSDCSDFFTLYSVVLGQYDLQDVQKDSVLVQYDNFFKKAKDKATGDEVQEVKLKVLCHRQEYLVPPQKKQKKQASHGTSSEVI
jgi:coatomer subunit beta'